MTKKSRKQRRKDEKMLFGRGKTGVSQSGVRASQRGATRTKKQSTGQVVHTPSTYCQGFSPTFHAIRLDQFAHLIAWIGHVCHIQHKILILLIIRWLDKAQKIMCQRVKVLPSICRSSTVDWAKFYRRFVQVVTMQRHNGRNKCRAPTQEDVKQLCFCRIFCK